MRKSLNKLLLLLSLSLFAVSIYQVTNFWDYKESIQDLDKLLNTTITKKTLLKEIRSSIDNNNFEDARMYLAIAKSSSHFKNKSFLINDSDSLKTNSELNQLALEIDKKDTVFRHLITQTANFSEGFIQGKSTNAAGVAGSISADFTVIGDVRDLTTEYINHKNGRNVNELLVVLSGTGIGLTALTMSTRGVTAPAKAGASIIKTAVKSQNLTRPFREYLLKLGKKVFDWPLFSRSLKNDKSISNIKRAAKASFHSNEIKPIKIISQRVNNVRNSTSTANTVFLLKYLDSPKDLINLEKISLKYGTRTKGMIKLLGKGALRSVRLLHKTTKLLLALISSLVSGFLSVFLFFFRKTLPV